MQWNLAGERRNAGDDGSDETPGSAGPTLGRRSYLKLGAATVAALGTGSAVGGAAANTAETYTTDFSEYAP